MACARWPLIVSLVFSALWTLSTAAGISYPSNLASRQAPTASEADWLLYVALYMRDAPPEDVGTAARYHWAIHSTQLGSKGKTTNIYHAVNGQETLPNGESRVDLDRFRYETRLINPDTQQSLISRIQFGKVINSRVQQIDRALREVELPNKRFNPFGDCSSWAICALDAIQEKVVSPTFDSEEFGERALAYGDERLAAIIDATAVSPFEGRRAATALSRYEPQTGAIVPEPARLTEVNAYEPISADAAAVKAGRGASREGLFFVADERAPGDVFEAGFKPPGRNLNIEQHFSPGMGEETGYVSLLRSRKAAVSVLDAAGVQGNKYVYVISPSNVPDGYYLPELKWNILLAGSSKYKIAEELEFAAAGKVPGPSVLGVYQKTAGSKKWVWRPNPETSAPPLESPRALWCFGRKRQEACSEFGGDSGEEGIIKGAEAVEGGAGLAKLGEEELNEVYTAFTGAEFERMGSSFGLGAEIERSSSGELSALSRIDASLVAAGNGRLSFRSILPEISKMLKGGMAVLGVALLGEWVWEMTVVFKSDSRLWEQVAVATALIPIVGCETREVSNIDSDSGSEAANIADFSLCVASDILLFTPAWPLGLLLKGIEVILGFALAPSQKSMVDSVREQRLDAWNKHQAGIMKQQLDKMRGSDFARDSNRQLKAETLSLVVTATKVAGGLHAGTLAGAASQEHRQQIAQGRKYVGALSLNIELCREFSLKKQKLADAMVATALDHMNRSQTSFNDAFFESVARNLLETTPVSEKEHIVPWGSDKEWAHFRQEAARIRAKMPELPQPMLPKDQDAIKEAALAAMTYEPLACKPSCQRDQDSECLWSHCGAVEPPSDDEVRASGMEEYAVVHTLFHVKILPDDVPESCRSAYFDFCRPVQWAMVRNGDSHLWPSKLLCSNRTRQVNVTLAEGTLPGPAPDYHQWID